MNWICSNCNRAARRTICFWPGVRGPGCFDPPRVYEPGSYENLCWLAFQDRAGWPVLALFLHVEKFVGGRPWGSVTLLDYREAAHDAETFPPLPGPAGAALEAAEKAVSPKVQYCSILEVIQYLKTGR